MFQSLAAIRRRFARPANCSQRQLRKSPRSRRMAVESLESRQMLSGTPANFSFHVVDDATANAASAFLAWYFNGMTSPFP